MGKLVAAGIASMFFVLPAHSEQVLRIAMTASDIPTTTGMSNNGFEGMRFLGYPVFEALVLWDLSRADRLAGLRPPGARRILRTGG
jgi:peptide/nickel transport system substrate-binding protein